MSLVRPLAIFFVIALTLAATSRQPVQAASREHTTRHASSAPAHVLTHSYPVRHRAEAHAVKARRIRHEVAEPAVTPRRNAVAERSTRRRSRSRSVVVRDVAMTREPMAHPAAGVNSMVEAAPTNIASGTSHPADAGVPTTETAANAPTPALSASDMAEAAIQPHVTPMYTRAGRLIVPAPLRGSKEILVHQNEMADAAGLERIENDEELDRLRYTHQLVDLAGTSALHINPELPENRRSARPWTAKFATDIARAYYAHFGQPLELNSAVRTISYQLRLQRVNGNAAAIEGETASPHLTGQAIDFGKKGMSMAEIAWMRMYLTPLMQAGTIDVEEEFQQACFHISVYRSYAGKRQADLAQIHKATGSPASPADLER